MAVRCNLFGVGLSPCIEGAGCGDDPPKCTRHVAMLSVVSSMFGMLVSAALFGDAAGRDIETGMHPLIFTSTLSRAEYLGGRSRRAPRSTRWCCRDSARSDGSHADCVPGTSAFGPFRTAAFIQPWLRYSPNLILAGAVMFATGRAHAPGDPRIPRRDGLIWPS